MWCLLLLKSSNSGGQILKACCREYSAFLFLKRRSFAYSTDHTSKDVLLPRVWLQGSELSLMLHFNLKIIKKKPFCKHIAATLSDCSERPGTYSLWNPALCGASGNQHGLILSDLFEVSRAHRNSKWQICTLFPSMDICRLIDRWSNWDWDTLCKFKKYWVWGFFRATTKSSVQRADTGVHISLLTVDQSSTSEVSNT